MPPKPGHRLDLYIVPDEWRELPPGGALLQDLGAGIRSRDVTVRDPVQRLDDLGGALFVRVDAPERAALYANRQGGFRVFCTACSENAVPTFQGALSAWRASGEGDSQCPQCGAHHTIDGWHTTPAIAFGRGALVLVDVQKATISESAHQVLESLLGTFSIVGSRR